MENADPSENGSNDGTERYRRLVNESHDIATIIDPNRRITYMSPAVRRVLGYEPEDIVGSDITDYSHPDDQKRIADAFEGVQQAPDEPQSIKYRFKHADGSWCWIEAVLRNRLADPVIDGILLNCRDITEQKRQDEKYRQLAREYGALLETSEDAIFLMDVSTADDDPEFRFAQLSPGYETQTGLTTEQVKGKTPREVFGEEHGAKLEAKYRRCVTQRESISYREELPVAEHTRFWETALSPVIIDGEIIRIVGIARNVTKQVERERELEATNQRLESLIETAPLPIMEIDTDGNVVLWNEGAEAMFGWSRQEVIGEFNPIVPEDRRTEFEANLQRALDGDRIHGKEIQRETKDGRELDLLLSVAPLTGQDGDVTSVLAVIENVTEQKELETQLRALQETAQRLSSAESTEEIGEIAVDAAVEILGLGITGIWEYSKRENALIPISETPASRKLFGETPRFSAGEALAWRVFESGEPRIYDDVQNEEHVHNPDTEVRSEILVPLGEYGLMATGSVSTQVFSETNIDLFRILGATVEAALARASREEELHGQNERLNRFASVVAHDLRNPLSVAMGYLGLAQETGDPDHFEKVELAHDRIDRLIGDILTLARGGESIENPEQVDLDRIAREAWGYVDTGEATLTVANDVPTVTGDAGRLTQLFENLFRNAVEHGGADVTVTVGRLHGDSGFYIEDDGIGIPTERRDELFDHGVTSKERGTGFGLSIVADIAAAHDWVVSATDGTDGGARFEFSHQDTTHHKSRDDGV